MPHPKIQPWLMQTHQSFFQIEPSGFGISLPELRGEVQDVLTAWINEGHQDGKSRQASFHKLEGVIFRKPVYFDLQGIPTVSKVDQVLVWESDSKLNLSVSSESAERLPTQRFVDLTSDQLLNNTPTVLDSLFSKFECRMGLDLLNKPFETISSKIDLDKLVSALRTPSRTAPIVVASGQGELSASKLAATVWNVLGSGAYIRAVPDEWLDEVNDELGISHSIPKNGVRVFAPNVRFDESRDGYRHEILNINLQDPANFSAAKIGKFRDRLAKAEWWQNNRQLISELKLLGLNSLRLKDLQTSREKSHIALGAKSVDTEELELRIKALEKDLEDFVTLASALEKEAANYKFEAEFSNLQFEEQSKELASARESGAYFRRILEENKLFGEIFIHEPNQFWAEVPTTFEDLVFAIPSIPFVEFTGSLDPVQVLDAQPGTISGIYRCWEALRALSDYARLKSEEKFNGSFYQYLQSDKHSGYQVSSGYFAHNESESVQNDPNLRAKRLFPVPVDHFSDGSAFMFAHAKLITGSSNSPRMHYLDDTAGTHKIFVGYIGAHLPTPGTN